MTAHSGSSGSGSAAAAQRQRQQRGSSGSGSRSLSAGSGSTAALALALSKCAAPAMMPASVPEGTWGEKKVGSKSQFLYLLPTIKFFEFRWGQ